MNRRALAGASASLLLVLVLVACAEGGGGTTVDAAGGGGDRDSGEPRDAAVDAPRRDASVACGPGQHACGGGCVDELANDPANGCRLGCGDPCPTPPAGTTSCSAAGLCDFTCTPPFRRVGDTCDCTPLTCTDMDLECGAPDDGCGEPLDCGTCGTGVECIDGRCACGPDPRERANDSSSTSPTIGSLDDSDDPPASVVDDGNLDVDRDVDWYRWTIVDGSDGGNPVVGVALDRVPTGATYELSAFFVCDDGTDATTCSSGTATTEIGAGCMSSGGPTASVGLDTDCEHFSTNDTGVLYVRVRATGTAECDPYRVSVTVR